MLLEDGSRLNIEDVLDRADLGQAATNVLIPLKGKEPLRARLVVRPLPADKAEIARKKLLKKASKKQRTTPAHPVPKGKRAQVIEAMREGRRRRSYAGAQVEAIHRRINPEVPKARAV